MTASIPLQISAFTFAPISKRLTHINATFLISMSRYSCVTAQFLSNEATDYPLPNPNDPVPIVKTRMVTQCDPGYNDDVTAALCENTPTLIDSIVPVTEPVSNIHYKNRYCAYCSGVEKTVPLIRWKVQLYSRHFFSLTKEDIPSYVRETRGNMFYIPPEYVNVRPCEPSCNIGTCNVTGKWPSYRYDRFIEIACESFTNPFNYTYKNIFCFYCNQDIDVSIARPLSCQEEESSSFQAYEFATMLRPEMLTNREDEDPLECSSAQFEDRKMVYYIVFSINVQGTHLSCPFIILFYTN